MKPIWTRTPEGGIMPRCMGFAWFDYTRGSSITILFPFNHLIGFFRWGWYKIRDAKVSQRDRDVGAKIREARRRWKQEGVLIGIAEVRRFFLNENFKELSFVILMIDNLDQKKRKIYKMEDYKA